jgi:hypothetical protein
MEVERRRIEDGRAETIEQEESLAFFARTPPLYRRKSGPWYSLPEVEDIASALKNAPVTLAAR